MLDSNFIWSPARGQWVAKSTPSSARPTTTTSVTSNTNNSPRKQHGGVHNSARASSQSHLPNIRNQSNNIVGGNNTSSPLPSATRLHTASSAERGIFRAESISQVGRVAQLFSDSHKLKESAMSKTVLSAGSPGAPTIDPPATSSIEKGTTSTRNVSYSYEQYNFVPVPGLRNHGIDGVACDDAERAMIGKKYVSREEMAAVELLKREQKKKDVKKSLAAKASVSEIDRFSQQQRCAGDSDDSDPSPDEQSVANQRSGANKRFSTSPGSTRKGPVGGSFVDGSTNSAGNSQITAPTVAGAEISGGVSPAAAAAPIPTESRLMELAGAYIHSLAIDCSTEELVMLYFRVVCGLDYSSAHRTSTAAVSQLLSDEIDQLHSSHHMLGVPPGSIPATTKIGSSPSRGTSSCSSYDDYENTATTTTADLASSSTTMPSSPRGGKMAATSSLPSSPKKPAITPLTGSVVASPSARRRSTAPNNNNGATPLKARSGSWARGNGINRASVVSAIVDEVYGDKQHSSDFLGVNGGGKAPTLLVNGGSHTSPTSASSRRKLPSKPISAAASPTSAAAATKKVGFSNNFQFGLNNENESVPLHIDSQQSLSGDTANGKKATTPPSSIVKSSALAFAASPKQQLDDNRPISNEDGEMEEDPLDSADPQRQYLIAGVPNPLSSNSISLRLASAFSTLVADVVKGKASTTTTPADSDVASSGTAQRAKSISAQNEASHRLLRGKPTHNSPHKPQSDGNASAEDLTANIAPTPPSSTGAPSSGPPASREEFLLRGEIVELMADPSVSGAAVLGSCYDIGHPSTSSPSMPYVVPTASRRAVLLSRQQRLVASLQRTRKASNGAAWNASLPSTHMSSLIHHNNTPGSASAVLPSYSVSGIHRPAMPLTEVIGPSEFHQLCTACILYGKEKKRRSASTTASPPSSKNRPSSSSTSTYAPPASSVIDTVELCMVYHALKEEIKERVHLKEQDEEQIRISIIELQELEEQRQRALAGCGNTLHNMGASTMGGSAGGFTAFPMMLDLGSLQGDGSGAFANGGGNSRNQRQGESSSMEAPLSSISNSSEEEEEDAEEFAIHADASDDDSPFSSQLAPVASESGMLVVQKKRFNSPGYGGRKNSSKPSSNIASPTTSQGGGGHRKKKVEKGTTLHSILTMQRQRKAILEEIEEIKEDLRLMEAEEREALAAVGGPIDVDLYDSAGSIAIPTQQTATQLGFERLLGIYRPPALMGVNADEVGNNDTGSPNGGPLSRRGSTLDNRSFGSMADLNSLMRSPSMNSLAGGSSRNLNKLRMLSSAANGGSVTEESLSSCNVSLYSIISTLTSVSRARADTKRRVAYFVRSFMPQNGWPLSAMFLTKEDPEALLRQQRAAINTKARMSVAPGSPAALQAAAAAAAATAGEQQIPPTSNANIIASISNKATQHQHQQLQRHILQLILSPNPQAQSATAQLVNLLGSATGITDYNNHKMVMAALGPFLFNSTLLNEFLIAKTSASSVLRGPSSIQASIFKRLNGSVMRPLGGGGGNNKMTMSPTSVGASSPNLSFPRNATILASRGGGGSTATSVNGSPYSSIPRPPNQPNRGGPSALSPQRLYEHTNSNNHFASPAPRPPSHSPQHSPNFLLRPHFSNVTEESSTHMLSTLMMGGGQLPMDGNHPSVRSGSAGGAAGSRGGGLASNNNGGTLGGTAAGSSGRLSVRRSTLRGGTNRRQSVSVLSPSNSAAMMPSHRASISGTVPNSPSSGSNPAFGVGLAGGGGIGLGGAQRHQQQLERTAYFLSQCVPANIFNPHFIMYFIEEHLHPLVKVVEKISITTALPPTAPSLSTFTNDATLHHDHHTSASAAPSPSGGVYPISAAAVNAWLTLCEEYLLPLSLLVLNRYYDVFAALPDWKAPPSSGGAEGISKHQQLSAKSLKSKMVDSIRSYLSQKNESVRSRYERSNQHNATINNTHTQSTKSTGYESTATMLELEGELLASITPDLRAQFMASIDPFVILLQTSVTHVAPRNSREYNVSMIASTNKGVDEFAGILSKNQPPPRVPLSPQSPRGGGTMSYNSTIDHYDQSLHPNPGGGPTTEALEIALGTVDGPTLAAAARTLLHYGNNGAGGLFGDGSLSGTNKEASAAADLLNTDMLSNNYGGGYNGSGGAHHHTTHNTSFSFHSGGNKGGGGVTNPFAPGFESSSSSSVNPDIFGNHIKPVMIMSVEAAATMCLAVPVLRHFFENAEGW